MTDIVDRLEERADSYEKIGPSAHHTAALLREAKFEIERLRDFVGWIDTWISNPARAYSHDALEGLFGMTRDKINALSPAEHE